MINYNLASKTYDHTRRHSDAIIGRFAQRVVFSSETAVLDFGCGSGNYLNQLQKSYKCRCFGVEPSEEMRKIAFQKNSHLIIKAGNHQSIPFKDNFFDFAFMTDVVHHVPNLPLMFSKLQPVLRHGALLCMVTQSHQQIQNRFYNTFFPSLVTIEQRRYPTIKHIIQCGEQNGFGLSEVEELPKITPAIITDEFVQNVAEKNYSMFRLLSEAEFEDGLEQIRENLGKQFDQRKAGETLVWLAKI